jgi:hypothetical protein
MMKFHTIGTTVVAELTDEKYIIANPQDFLDLIGDMLFRDCNRIIIHKKNLHEDFFRLHTRVAGDILQKISNYRFKLAIVGDFSEYKSKSLQDFIRESNKGENVFFVDTIEVAFNRLKTGNNLT